MLFKIKSKIILEGKVYERGDIIDLPEGSETRNLFVNKIDRHEIRVVEDANEDYVLEGTDTDTPVVEIQANFTPEKPKKAKKK